MTARPSGPLRRDTQATESRPKRRRLHSEQGRRAIDLISGSELLREWVDDPAATPDDLDALATADEAAWQAQRQAALLY